MGRSRSVRANAANWQKRGSSANKENIGPDSTAAARGSGSLSQALQALQSTRNVLSELQTRYSGLQTRCDTFQRSANRYKQQMRETRSEKFVQTGCSCGSAPMVSRGEYDAVCIVLNGQKRFMSALRKENKRLHDTLRRECRDRDKAISKAVATAKVVMVKEKGIVPHRVRALIRDWHLICNIPSKRLFPAIRMFCDTFELTLCGTFSHGLIGLCVKKALVGSRLQVATAVKEAVGITLSSDGTSHHGQNFTSHHITCKAADGAVTTLNAGVKRVPNKTSEHALAVWQSLTDEMWELLNSTIPGSTEHMTAAIFLSAVCGTTGDHAADQRKLNRLIFLWKQSVDRLERGREVVKALPDLECSLLVAEMQYTRIEELGGADAWAKLSDAERAQHIQEGKDEVARRLGWEAFDQLDAQSQASVDFFYHFGCKMHKELNTVVAGNKALQEFWAKAGYTAPMLLPNKDNTSSQCGGAKLASMLGSLFRNKNPNKGYQRQFNTWMTVKVFGPSPERYRTIEFPDVGRARFQMTCVASGFTLRHLELIREFLWLMRGMKDTTGFNNFEANVYKALRDPPTLRELACLALYAIAVTVPYVALVRRPGVNALDLAPMHVKIKFHCHLLASDPRILTEVDPDTSHTDAAFGGKPYRDVEVVRAIYELHRGQQLPHLNEALSAFLLGAELGWDHFTPEFKPGSTLSTASAADIARSHAQPTNDRAEGAFGGTKRIGTVMPHASDTTIEAKLSYRENNTRVHIAQLPTAVQDAMRAQGLRIEKEDRRNPAAAVEVAHMEAKAATNLENARQKEKREQDAKAALETRLTEHEGKRLIDSALVTEKLTHAALDAELEWHRHRGLPEGHADKIPAVKARLKTKPDKISALNLLTLSTF